MFKRDCFLLSFCLVICIGSPAFSQTALRVLFVGNSLTYVNDLPSLVQELGKQDGVSISCTTIALPDYSLQDHWNDGKAEDAIEEGHYDFVIMQQGPSALPESQVLLLEYAKRFAEVCKKFNAKPALYMVWPSKARSFDRDGVISSYSKAAAATGSILCPAGLGWKYAWQSDPSLPLYSPDDFHPSVMGSVLAALVIYGAITGKKDFEFILYANSSWRTAMSAASLSVLKEAAVKALGKQEQ
jgi:hypothetical protein